MFEINTFINIFIKYKLNFIYKCLHIYIIPCFRNLICIFKFRRACPFVRVCVNRIDCTARVCSGYCCFITTPKFNGLKQLTYEFCRLGIRSWFCLDGLCGIGWGHLMGFSWWMRVQMALLPLSHALVILAESLGSEHHHGTSAAWCFEGYQTSS